MGVGTFALGGLGGLSGGCGCGFFDGERLCGFGWGKVVGGFIFGFISFVLVWHGDCEGLVCLQLIKAVVALLIVL